MDLREALRSTGAARTFTSEPVAPVVVAAILDDARFAPSGGNRQPWRVAVITSPAQRTALGELMRPVWEEYAGIAATGATPFAHGRPSDVAPRPARNALLDGIADVPVVLAVAVDLDLVAVMDADLERPAITGGASVYPFCWNILLAARARGLGGVITTFLARAERAAAGPLGLADHQAVAATIFLGHPEHQPTRLRREPVPTFATVDRFDGAPFDA